MHPCKEAAPSDLPQRLSTEYQRSQFSPFLLLHGQQHLVWDHQLLGLPDTTSGPGRAGARSQRETMETI